MTATDQLNFFVGTKTQKMKSGDFTEIQNGHRKSTF